MIKSKLLSAIILIISIIISITYYAFYGYASSNRRGTVPIYYMIETLGKKVDVQGYYLRRDDKAMAGVAYQEIFKAKESLGPWKLTHFRRSITWNAATNVKLNLTLYDRVELYPKFLSLWLKPGVDSHTIVFDRNVTITYSYVMPVYMIEGYINASIAAEFSDYMLLDLNINVPPFPHSSSYHVTLIFNSSILSIEKLSFKPGNLPEMLTREASLEEKYYKSHVIRFADLDRILYISCIPNGVISIRVMVEKYRARLEDKPLFMLQAVYSYPPNYPVPIFKVDNWSLYRVMFRYKSGIDFHPELAGHIGYICYFQSHNLGDRLTIGIDSLNNVYPIGLLPPLYIIGLPTESWSLYCLIGELNFSAHRLNDKLHLRLYLPNFTDITSRYRHVLTPIYLIYVYLKFTQVEILKVEPSLPIDYAIANYPCGTLIVLYVRPEDQPKLIPLKVELVVED